MEFKLNLKKPLAIFDLETTGLDIIEDRIVEISIIKLLPNYEKKIFSKRINPTIPIKKEASQIHGITNNDVKNLPEFKMIAKEVFRFLEGCDLAGFNVIKFDIPLLIEEFLRVNIDFKLERRNIIDAQKIYHLKEKRTLSAAYKFYCNKKLENAHNSLNDSMATLAILESQIKKYEGTALKDNFGKEICKIENNFETLNTFLAKKMIDFAGRMVINEEGVPVFNFGKYKNKPIRETLKKDPSYYDWVIKSSFSNDTKRKLTKFKLELNKNFIKN